MVECKLSMGSILSNENPQNIWHIHMVYYYVALKGNKILILGRILMNTEKSVPVRLAIWPRE